MTGPRPGPRPADPPADPEPPLESALAGSGKALDALWRDHRRWVAAILMAHMPREADLEDLLQEVALRMVAKLSTLREPEAFRPWLRALALNAARSSARKQKVRRRVLRALPEDGNDPEDPAVEKDRRSREHRERLDRTLEVIRGLKPTYSEPLLLRAVQGLSQREIAEALDLPETTVETRLARGRRMLRDALSREMPEWAGPRSARG